MAAADAYRIGCIGMSASLHEVPYIEQPQETKHKLQPFGSTLWDYAASYNDEIPSIPVTQSHWSTNQQQQAQLNWLTSEELPLCSGKDVDRGKSVPYPKCAIACKCSASKHVVAYEFCQSC
jgi:hypothetical protein